MDIRKTLIAEIFQLPKADFQRMVELVFLMRSCSGFREEFNRLIQVENIGQEQLEAVNAIMHKWLYEKDWADILRARLASVGMAV